MLIERDFSKYSKKKLNENFFNSEVTLQGTLMPCRKILSSGELVKNKLHTRSGEVYLRLNRRLELKAEELTWEDVKVTGHLQNHRSVLDVSTLLSIENQVYYPFFVEDESKVLREYEEQIHRQGKLDVECEEMAS